MPHRAIGERYDLGPDDAADHIGRVVLIGLTIVDDNDEVVEQQQFAGVIEEVSDVLGIRLPGQDELYTLPPQIERAAPGVYRLRSTGDEITDPDFLVTWTISPPSDEA